MANSWFQFQQFRIEQGRSAMKVCTDACVFGAWVQSSGPIRMLDVGCGTGLLSLMAAQTNSLARIAAIEPHEGSFLDARQNVNQSPWSDRIQVYNVTFQDWIDHHSGLYDAVICNPPFFLGHLQSPDKSRNGALHLSETEWLEWLMALPRFLKPTGQLWLLLSPDTWKQTQLTLLQAGVYPVEIQLILQKNHKPFRNLVRLSFTEGPATTKSENLYGIDGQLSAWATNLLAPFYLNKAIDL